MSNQRPLGLENRGPSVATVMPPWPNYDGAVAAALYDERRALRDALRGVPNADWLLQTTQTVEYTVASEQRQGQPHGPPAVTTRATVQVTLHQDFADGRGSAIATLVPGSYSPNDLVAQLTQRTATSARAPWQTEPLAAAAQVKLFDPNLAEVDALEVVGQFLQRTLRERADAQWQATRALQFTVMEQARGMVVSWAESALHTTVRFSDIPTLAQTWHVRRLADLPGPAVAALVHDAQRIVAASPLPLPPGTELRIALAPVCALFDGARGIYDAFADHYAAGAREWPGQRPFPRPTLTLPSEYAAQSNGTRDYGLYSAPIADSGYAVRDFAIGAPLQPGHRVRNIHIAGVRHATTDGAVPDTAGAALAGASQPRPLDDVLQILRFGDVAFDPATDTLLCEIMLARRATAPETSYTGGTLAIKRCQAFAQAAWWGEKHETPAYQGPYWLQIPAVYIG